IHRTSVRPTATGTPQTTGTTILDSGLGARFTPEPARSWSRRASTKRPGPSMMSRAGAALAPGRRAALVLGDAWAPAGAAGHSTNYDRRQRSARLGISSTLFATITLPP